MSRHEGMEQAAATLGATNGQFWHCRHSGAVAQSARHAVAAVGQMFRSARSPRRALRCMEHGSGDVVALLAANVYADLLGSVARMLQLPLLRNRGNGTFEDVSQKAGAAFGRWAWSSDAFDFDNDGWEDLYVVNGMFTREDDQPSIDVDSFFWRQVVAQSPLARTPGTPYNDGWRATNRLLLSGGSQAQHERSVLLRNDGHGGFDEVSGVAGVDVDQDGRSFAVADFDHDGDADIVLMAPRSSPQLRLFRNDFASGHAAVAIRLTGTKSNRDAIGAQVTVETDRGRFTRVVKAGSGFLSQHSKEVLVGLGTSERIAAITILWPSGLTQNVTDVPVNHSVSIVEGDVQVGAEPFQKASVPSAAGSGARAARKAKGPGTGTWLYQPFPAPDLKLRDSNGREQSLSGAGRPRILCFWATSAPPSLAAIETLARQRGAITAAGACSCLYPLMRSRMPQRRRRQDRS